MGRGILKRAGHAVSSVSHSVGHAASNVGHALGNTVSNIAHEAEHVVHNVVHETANAARLINDEANPYRKAHLERDKSIAENRAELTRQFEIQKQNLTKEIATLRTSLNTAKANIPAQARSAIEQQVNSLKSSIEHLAIFDAAINDCMYRKSDMKGLKQLLDYFNAGEQHLVEAFMTFNPLGLAMIFDCKKAVALIHTHFAKFIKPEDTSIIGLSLVDCLNYVASSDYIRIILNIQNPQNNIEEQQNSIYTFIKNCAYTLLTHYRNNELKEKIENTVKVFIPEYKQNCSEIFASAIPTVSITVNEDANSKLILIDEELARLDSIHDNEQQQLKADYDKSHHEMYNAVMTQARLGKRKIHKSLAITVAAIAAGGWMAPHVAIAIGINPAAGTAFAMLRGALTYGTSSAINREFRVKQLAKSVAAAGIGEVVAGQISEIKFIPLNKEFVAGFSSGVVGSVIYGDVKNALTNALIDGTIQYSSTAVATMAVPLSNTSSISRVSTHFFIVGSTAAVMATFASRIVFRKTLDFTVAAVSGFAAILSHMAQLEAEKAVEEHKAKQEEIKRKELREQRRKLRLEETQIPVITANTYIPDVDLSDRPAPPLADLSDQYMAANEIVPEPKVKPKSNLKNKTAPRINSAKPIAHQSDISHLKNGDKKIAHRSDAGSLNRNKDIVHVSRVGNADYAAKKPEASTSFLGTMLDRIISPQTRRFIRETSKNANIRQQTSREVITNAAIDIIATPFKFMGEVTHSIDEFEHVYNPTVLTDDLASRRDSLHMRNIHTRDSFIQAGVSLKPFIDTIMPLQSMTLAALEGKSPIEHQYQQSTKVAAGICNFVTSIATEYTDGLDLSVTQPRAGTMQATNAVINASMVATAVHPANLLRSANAANKTMTFGFDMSKNAKLVTNTTSKLQNGKNIARVAANDYTNRAASLFNESEFLVKNVVSVDGSSFKNPQQLEYVRLNIARADRSKFPKTRNELHDDLISKGFKRGKDTARNYPEKGGGIVQYKGQNGVTITIKDSGEVIRVERKWTSDGSKKFPERQDYFGNRIPDQSHSTGHFVEPYIGPPESKLHKPQ